MDSDNEIGLPSRSSSPSIEMEDLLGEIINPNPRSASMSPDSLTGNKRRHEEMSAPDTSVKIPLTPQIPDDPNQNGRSRLRENEKSNPISASMGPPPKPQRSSDEDDMPISGQRDTQMHDGSPPPISTKRKKALQQKRDHPMKKSVSQGEQNETEQAESFRKKNDSDKTPFSFFSETAAQQQESSDSDDSENEDSGDQEEASKAGEEEDEEDCLSPGDSIAPSDWTALNRRYGEMILRKTEEERKLWEEYSSLTNVSKPMFP